MLWEIQYRKVAANFFSLRIVSMGSIYWIREVPNVNSGPIGSNSGTPVTILSRNPNKPAAVISQLAAITHIARMIAVAEIFAAIVEAVSIAMIDFKFWRAFHDRSMHFKRGIFALTTRCKESLAGMIPNGEPSPLH